MSVYSVKGKGFRYDFTQKGERYTEAWFKTKKAAHAAEAKRREELRNPQPEMGMEAKELASTESVATGTQTETGITFLELVNLRLDFVKAYRSEEHYHANVYLARRWVKNWGGLDCRAIRADMVQKFLLGRRQVSPFTANKDLRHLRATFNYLKKKGYIAENPTDGIDFFPVERKIKYVPPLDEIEKVISIAKSDIQDYLRTICDTMARVGEVNRLKWDDVNFESRHIILYTRKKRGGHLTPRKVPMTERLHKILSHRFSERNRKEPWVFCNSYVDPKSGIQKVVPYRYRRTILKTLCSKAGVREFTFHALRHSGASIMDSKSVPLGAIQKILGHENRSTTEIYLHSIGRAEHDAISVFEEATKNSHTNSHTADLRKADSHMADLN